MFGVTRAAVRLVRDRPADLVRIPRLLGAELLFGVRYGRATHGETWFEGHGALGDGERYAGIRVVRCRAAFRRLSPEHRAGGFLDLGCGRGRALVIAQEFGFESVTGVELVADECDRARRFVTKVAARRGVDPAVVVEADAARWVVADTVTTLFMNNPFGRATVAAVLDRVEESLARRPRPFAIVYAKEDHAHLLAGRGFREHWSGDHISIWVPPSDRTGDSPGDRHGERFTTRVARGDELDALAERYEACRRRDARTSPTHPADHTQQLDQLRRTYSGADHELEVVVLLDGDRDGEVVGVAPVVRSRQPYRWSLRLPHTRLVLRGRPIPQAHFHGTRLLGPTTDEAQRALFTGVLDAAAGCQLLRFEYVDTSSMLWALLQEQPRVTRDWRSWCPNDPTVDLSVRLADDMATYLQRTLTAKARYNVRREDRRLDEATRGSGSPLRLEVITELDQIGPFLDDCERVMQQSGQLLSGARPVANRGDHPRRLAWFAERGALRCYLLRADAGPIAFLLGYRYDDTVLAGSTAFAEEWARYSPGKVMWLRILADLHAADGIDRLDFGYGDWPYMRHLANEERHFGRRYLVRRTPWATARLTAPMLYWSGRRRAVRVLRTTDLGTRLQRYARQHLGR